MEQSSESQTDTVNWPPAVERALKEVATATTTSTRQVPLPAPPRRLRPLSLTEPQTGIGARDQESGHARLISPGCSGCCEVSYATWMPPQMSSELQTSPQPSLHRSGWMYSTASARLLFDRAVRDPLPPVQPSRQLAPRVYGVPMAPRIPSAPSCQSPPCRRQQRRRPRVVDRSRQPLLPEDPHGHGVPDSQTVVAKRRGKRGVSAAKPSSKGIGREERVRARIVQVLKTGTVSGKLREVLARLKVRNRLAETAKQGELQQVLRREWMEEQAPALLEQLRTKVSGRLLETAETGNLFTLLQKEMIQDHIRMVLTHGARTEQLGTALKESLLEELRVRDSSLRAQMQKSLFETAKNGTLFQELQAEFLQESQRQQQNGKEQRFREQTLQTFYWQLCNPGVHRCDRSQEVPEIEALGDLVPEVRQDRHEDQTFRQEDLRQFYWQLLSTASAFSMLPSDPQDFFAEVMSSDMVDRIISAILEDMQHGSAAAC